MYTIETPSVPAGPVPAGIGRSYRRRHTRGVLSNSVSNSRNGVGCRDTALQHQQNWLLTKVKPLTLQASSLSTAASFNQELQPPDLTALVDSHEVADLSYHHQPILEEVELEELQPPQQQDQTSTREAIKALFIGAGTLPELQSVIAKEAARMDGMNASHALYRLAKLVNAYSRTMDAAGVPLAEAMPAVWDRHVGPCLATLSPMLVSCLGVLEARDVASNLWACATIGYYDRALFDMLCAKAVAVLPDMKPVDCANIMVAFARFGHYHPEVVRMIPQVLLVHMYETKPCELSQVMWGYGRLRVPGAPGKVFLEAATDAMNLSMEQFGPQELSTMLWAFVKLHHYPGRALLLRSESLTVRRLVESRPRPANSNPLPTSNLNKRQQPAAANAAHQEQQQQQLQQRHQQLQQQPQPLQPPTAPPPSPLPRGPVPGVSPAQQVHLSTPQHPLSTSTSPYAHTTTTTSNSGASTSTTATTSHPSSAGTLFASSTSGQAVSNGILSSLSASSTPLQPHLHPPPPEPDHLHTSQTQNNMSDSNQGASISPAGRSGLPGPDQARAGVAQQPSSSRSTSGNCEEASSSGSIEHTASRYGSLPGADPASFSGSHRAWTNSKASTMETAAVDNATHARCSNHDRGAGSRSVPRASSNEQASSQQGGSGVWLPQGVWHAPSQPIQPLVPQDIGNLLWAYGKLRFKSARLLDELPLFLGSWLHEFRTPDLCCLLAGYTNARHYHRGVLEALAPLMVARLHTLNISELVVLLWSYGIFQHRPLSEPRFLDAVSAALAHQLRPGTHAQTYSVVIKAFANLRYWPEGVLSKMVENTEARIGNFRPDEMAALLYGLSHLAASKHTHQQEEQRLLMQAASSASASNNSNNSEGILPGASKSTGTEPGVGDVSPILSPPLVHLFRSFIRQCMHVMDKAATEPVGSRINYEVLNSIVFSCLRVGQSPWMLIDYAESKGIRLVQPGVAMAKLQLEREFVAKAAIEALTGVAPITSSLSHNEVKAVRASRVKKRGGKARRSFKKRLAAEAKEDQEAKEEADAIAAEHAEAASVALAGQAAAASRPEGLVVPPPRAQVTLPGQAVSGHWLSGSSRGWDPDVRAKGRLSHRRGAGLRRRLHHSQQQLQPPQQQQQGSSVISCVKPGLTARGIVAPGLSFADASSSATASGSSFANRANFSGTTSVSSTPSAYAPRPVSSFSSLDEPDSAPGLRKGEGHVGVVDGGELRPAQPQTSSSQQGSGEHASNLVSMDIGLHTEQPELGMEGRGEQQQGNWRGKDHALQSRPVTTVADFSSSDSRRSTRQEWGGSPLPDPSLPQAALNQHSHLNGRSMSSMRAELGVDKARPYFSSPSLLARPVASPMASRDEDRAPSPMSSQDDSWPYSPLSSRDEDRNA